MAWSTRELAELAGTTVNTVRHYHRLGLLPEPDRRLNNYKQYGVSELVQLLRIRRLVDLGVPLAQISAVSDSEEGTSEALQAIDAQLAERITELQRARADIAAILDGDAPVDVPRGFETVASRLSPADSSIIHIYSKLYDDDALADLRSMVETDPDTVDAEFNALTDDTDEAARGRLVEVLAQVLAKHLTDYPWLSDPGRHLPKGATAAQETFVEAITELYNPAQIDVIGRASVRAQALMDNPSEAPETPPDGPVDAVR